MKSSNPVVYSPLTANFEIHYLSVKDIKINNDLPLVICGASGNLSITDPVMLPSNLKIIWYKNGTIIQGETSSSIIVTSPGNYKAEIDYGSCSQAPYPKVISLGISVTANTNIPNYTINSSNGDNVLKNVTSTILTCSPIIAGNTYQWFKDGNLQSETTSVYTTDEPGDYKLIIKDQFCTYEAQKKLKLLVLGGVIPNMVSPNGDGDNDFWKIPGENIGTNTNVTIIDSNGKTVLKTDNYNNDWPQTSIDFDAINPVYYYIITPLNGIVHKGTITIVK
jgi:gliding motility-associated-like protein